MKNRLWLLGLMAGLSLTVTACGNKKADPEPEIPEEVIQEESEVEEVEVQPDTDFSFLEVMGQDCQMLPGDVEAETSDTIVIAKGTTQEWLGGAPGTLSYTYEAADPFITEISWSAVNCEVKQAEDIEEILKGRYGEPDHSEETRLSEGTTHLYTWNHGDDCRVRASIDQNSVNGGNVTIVWSQRRADDQSFLTFLGKKVETLPQDKVMDMSEGEDGLLLLMEETYQYGICGSVSFGYDNENGVIRTAVWDSNEMTLTEVSEFLEAVQKQYGTGTSSTVKIDGENHENWHWADAEGYALDMTMLDYGAVCLVKLTWK